MARSLTTRFSAFALAAALGTASFAASAEESLTVVSWGGAYGAAQQKHVIDPFQKESGAKVVGVGYDSGKTQKDAIMDGTLLGSITQNPVGIGECVVNSLAKAMKGETLPKVIDTGFYWYDKTNITDPKVAAVLYD